MLDFLFALGQFLSVLGLLYGLILVIAHGRGVDAIHPHYDPVIGHDWFAIGTVPHQSASQSSGAEPETRDQNPTRVPQIS
jgi:hypothetical protein